MFAGIDNSEVVESIIGLVREQQKRKIPINYTSLISNVEYKFSKTNKKDIDDIKTLLYNLRDSNPYN